MQNHISITGYLGRDPEKTTVQGQKGPYSKTTISVAVSRDYGDRTNWFYCISYRSTADFIEKWFRKGSPIQIEGSMESYHPDNDPKRTSWYLEVEKARFCPRDKNADAGAQGAPTTQQDIGPLQEDDVPF